MVWFHRLSVVMVFFCGVFAVAFAGCGSSGPDTADVTGKVTIDGQPPEDCRIEFHPVDPSKQVASGQIAADGSYTLSTGVTGTPGAMVGKYKVVLFQNTAADTSYMETGEDPTLEEPSIEGGGVVPEEYTDATTTPKEVEVTAGSNTINIEI